MDNNMKKRKWINYPTPAEKGMKSDGWLSYIEKVYVDEDKLYCIMSRELDTKEFGRVIHVCMRNAFGCDIPWREKQRIKNEIFGEEYGAIEVFPEESKLVDAANMYHIWILKEHHLSFGIHSNQL